MDLKTLKTDFLSMSDAEKLQTTLRVRNSRKTRMEKLEVNENIQTMNEIDKLTAKMSPEDIAALMEQL